LSPSSQQKRRAALKMEAIVSSEMLILSTKLHDFTSLKTVFTNLFRKDTSGLLS
jgi:hypothetical protein